MPQIPNPAQNSSAYNELKRSLKAAGFGYKHNYEGAKIIKTTKYTWPSYTISIVNGPTVTIGAGQFCAYVCIYPEYETRYVNITKTDNRFSQYYEDNIDEVLGGPVQTLGG